jgi:outer membrane protein OmpA-like peptidoglycan-associated protein
VTETRAMPPLLRALAAGMIVVASLAAEVMVVMSVWSPRREAQAPVQIAQAGEPVQLTQAQAPAPKQSAPAPKQQQPAPKQEPQAQGPKPAQIDRNGVLILIREALIALDQANKTGNYTVLRDLGSPEFQANSAARLAEIFAQHRRDNIDLSGVAVIDPQLTLLPQIEGNGLMRMAGFFPSVPTQVNFELIYAPVGGRWRLFGLSVSFGQAAPAAPQPPPQAPPQAAAPPAPAAPAKPKP